MQHIAFIMDGNRRWARENRLESVTSGHKVGVDAVERTIKFCVKNGIKYLSLFAFSIENFRRSLLEKSFLFDLLSSSIKNQIDLFTKHKIKVRFSGDRSLFPKQTLKSIEYIEEKTKEFDDFCVNVLFCYGSKQEIVSAVKSIAKKVECGELKAEEVNEEAVRKEMWTDGIPDPDLIVRTGKTHRLSNFLLFQAAYSEIMFLDRHWPEIDEECLDECVKEFYGLKRNFGK